MGKDRVLVTGIDGFTGAHLERELRDTDYRVFGMTKHAEHVSETVLGGDLTVVGEVQHVIEAVSPNHIVHLAGLSFVEHEDPEAVYRVNVLGTLNLLEAISRAGASVAKILIASSAHVYGAVQQSELDESVCPRPINHYGASKLAMEHLVATWFDRLPILMVRPFNYTGPGQSLKFLIPKIVDHFARRQPRIELGNLDVEREFVDVRAVCRCYRLLLESDVAGTVLNVCSGRAHALSSILDLMSEIAGYRIEVEVNPAFLRKNEIRRLIGSNERLHRVIGEQRYPAIEETLRWMYDAALDRRPLPPSTP
jgi:nucleoside-diphosphate-sugar epimerase